MIGNWNYRIIQRDVTVSFDGESTTETITGIHEVYYDEDKNPRSYSAEPEPLFSTEGRTGLKWVMDRMREAMDKPILTPNDFPS